MGINSIIMTVRHNEQTIDKPKTEQPNQFIKSHFKKTRFYKRRIHDGMVRWARRRIAGTGSSLLE